MKMYLAAKYDKRRELLPIAALLMLNGHDITSKWLDGSHDGTSDEANDKYALLDLEHIDNANVLVLFNLPIGASEQSSGRNVEFGYALAQGKHIITVGKGSCIFYTQADSHFDTIEEFLAEYAPVGRL